MNTPPKTDCLLVKPLSIFAATALGLCLSTSDAATILNFGPSDSYVSQPTSFRRVASSAEGTSGPYTTANPFSDTDRLSPDSYSGPAFYGGYTLTSSTYKLNFATNGQSVLSNYNETQGKDTIYLNVNGAANADFHGTEMSFASVFVFRQDDFNTGFTTGNVGVDGFRLQVWTHGHGANDDYFKITGRWLVQIEGVYYLSQASFTQPRQSLVTHALSGEQLLATQWAVYNPNANISFSTPSGGFSSIDLSNISAVGFYVEDPFFQSNNTLALRLGIGEFSVTGSAIPESKTGLLMGVGLIALLARKIGLGASSMLTKK